LIFALTQGADDMSDPFISEIRMMAFSYAPQSWVQCNGQIMSIQQNTALFSLLGTAYGGNGMNTFGLPNLQGRVPMHMGNGFSLGQQVGEESHTLVTAEMPQHFHDMSASTAAATLAIGTPGTALAEGQTPGSGGQPVNLYAPAGGTTVAFNAGAVSNTGGSQPHENRQPYLALNFCIALSGLFPSRT
jgi:microcystin-dependent protein